MYYINQIAFWLCVIIFYLDKTNEIIITESPYLDFSPPPIICNNKLIKEHDVIIEEIQKDYEKLNEAFLSRKRLESMDSTDFTASLLIERKYNFFTQKCEEALNGIIGYLDDIAWLYLMEDEDLIFDQVKRRIINELPFFENDILFEELFPISFEKGKNEITSCKYYTDECRYQHPLMHVNDDGDNYVKCCDVNGEDYSECCDGGGCVDTDPFGVMYGRRVFK